MMTDEINFYFRKKEYGWLSNFWRCHQTVKGLGYNTNEHYYQAQKTADINIYIWIVSAPTPYLAMVGGRGLRAGKGLKPDWDSLKVQMMKEGLQAKFKNDDLAKRLLATGDAILHEDSPTDMFWGKKGKDMLGKLLMEVREEIRKELKE